MPSPTSNIFKLIGLLAIVGIPTGVIAYLVSQKDSPTPIATTETTHTEYTDGAYSAVGHYISPGGQEEVSVSLTLAGGIITDVTYSADSKSPISQQMQKIFGENYKPFVLGKNIDEVHLTKVSSSSLTPKGFNDALEQIKAEARVQ